MQRNRAPAEPQRRHVDMPMTEWDRAGGPGFNSPLFQQMSPRGTHYQHLTDGGAHLMRGAGGPHGGGGHGPLHGERQQQQQPAWYGGGGMDGAFGMVGEERLCEGRMIVWGGGRASVDGRERAGVCVKRKVASGGNREGEGDRVDVRLVVKGRTITRRVTAGTMRNSWWASK